MPKSYSWPCKNILGKRTQQWTLSQFENKVKMNNIVTNTGDFKVNSLKVVYSLITTLKIRLDKSQDLI